MGSLCYITHCLFSLLLNKAGPMACPFPFSITPTCSCGCCRRWVPLAQIQTPKRSYRLFWISCPDYSKVRCITLVFVCVRACLCVRACVRACSPACARACVVVCSCRVFDLFFSRLRMCARARERVCL